MRKWPVHQPRQHRLHRRRVGSAASHGLRLFPHTPARMPRRPPCPQVRDRGAGEHRSLVLQHLPLRVGVGVPVLDQQPLRGPLGRAHQRPRAPQLVPPQCDRELPRLQLPPHPLLRGVPVAEGHLVLVIGRVDARVPHDDVPGPVVPVGDDALEGGVVQRVVLHQPREALLLRVHRRPLGHRPRLQDAVHLQPKVVVQPSCRVLLHHEAQARL